jgi:RNA polymerase-binding transcription factor DksA
MVGMAIDTTHFKKILEEERRHLIRELATVGRINPENPGDWELKPADLDILNADLNEVADRSEELQENSAILDDLEYRYRAMTHALKRIEEGTYGVCEIGGETIEVERLEANPAARTCKAHLEQEGSLGTP